MGSLTYAYILQTVMFLSYLSPHPVASHTPFFCMCFGVCWLAMLLLFFCHHGYQIIIIINIIIIALVVVVELVVVTRTRFSIVLS